jgi:ParB-like chromosome segregation protein Spo0J
MFQQVTENFETMQIGTIYNVPVDKINLTGVRIRAVKTKSIPYLELEEDIRNNGVLVPVECYVLDNKLYLHNGGHRVQACTDLGIVYINVLVIAVPSSDLDSARAQVSKNLSIRSKLNELLPYIRAEIIAGTSVAEIAAILGKTPKSIYDMVSIKQENPLIDKMLKNDTRMVNVLAFNKELELIKCLPEKEQEDLIRLAANTEQRTFQEIIALKKRGYNSALKNKKQAEKDMSELKEETKITYPVIQERVDMFVKNIAYKESPYYNVWLFFTGQAETITN